MRGCRVHSSPHHKRARVPSFEELRSDSQIQAEVQKRFHTYDNVSRLDVKGRSTDVYKSGRFRAGIHKVRHVIPWPQDYCTTVSGYKRPTYDDLNVFEWSQGFVYCVLEESHSKTRENMLRYCTSLMQDAVEMSFATAKRAHTIVLQEIEKGNCDLDNLDKIEKLRCRHTQRNISMGVKKSVDSSDKVQNCKLYNKGMCRHDNVLEHVEKGILYQHYCSHCFAITGKRFKHPKTQCLRFKRESKDVDQGQKV